MAKSKYPRWKPDETPKPSFKIGKLVTTAGIYNRMLDNVKFHMFVMESFFNKYVKCDWGTLSKEDKEQNDRAIIEGERIMAQYDEPGQPRIWIITEWDRSVTTILFPEEY